MGKAASVAWILFLLVFIVTIINWKFGGKESQG
jgi:ABC-type sugar transport system permease subunit